MSVEGKDLVADADADVRGFDPWGLRRVERLLQTIEGVDSLKIVPDSSGGIDEVHVLSSAGLGAKQIVRNIESALLAQFGLQVDHRKISVAQVREQDLPRAEPPPEPEPAGRRLILKSFQIERLSGERVKTRVWLNDADSVFEGEAEGPDYARARLEVTARAVLNALAEATPDEASFAIEGVEEIELFGRDLMMALVQAFSGRQVTVLPGISRIRDSEEEAVVLACLNATNRWVNKA